ncbi:MAG: pantetheine-phosphate adenylyltransferase [Clostridia bacterium]|nr:pantetheine-phosphate adenylyltransferase [Clostridia bacterium]
MINLTNIAIYPGSFDPCTNGHLDIIERSSKIFEKVIVAVLLNSSKTPTFTVEERIDLLKTATEHITNVEVVSFNGLLAQFAQDRNAKVIIKGLRAVSDFEYEFQMSLTNTKLNPNVETLFMTTKSENMYLSSSIVREVARYGGDISDMVPKVITEKIYKKFK